jgi:hypothetical protein
MPVNEKGRPAGGDPIPNDVRKDKLEFKPQPRDLQVSRLIRRCAIGAGLATTLAPFVFGEVSQ